MNDSKLKISKRIEYHVKQNAQQMQKFVVPSLFSGAGG